MKTLPHIVRGSKVRIMQTTRMSELGIENEVFQVLRIVNSHAEGYLNSNGKFVSVPLSSLCKVLPKRRKEKNV